MMPLRSFTLYLGLLIENQDSCLNNCEAFIARLKPMFGNNDAIFTFNQKLKTIKQRKIGEIQKYILDFNKCADDSSWNKEAKMNAFLDGLQDQIAAKINHNSFFKLTLILF